MSSLHVYIQLGMCIWCGQILCNHHQHHYLAHFTPQKAPSWPFQVTTILPQQVTTILISIIIY